jgi:hypothetical protein
VSRGFGSGPATGRDPPAPIPPQAGAHGFRPQPDPGPGHQEPKTVSPLALTAAASSARSVSLTSATQRSVSGMR